VQAHTNASLAKKLPVHACSNNHFIQAVFEHFEQVNLLEDFCLARNYTSGGVKGATEFSGSQALFPGIKTRFPAVCTQTICYLINSNRIKTQVGSTWAMLKCWSS
jgi:hypothetical protein